jgi:hypothetical protein
MQCPSRYAHSLQLSEVSLPLQKVLIAMTSAFFIGAGEAFLYARFFHRKRLEILAQPPPGLQLLDEKNPKRPDLKRSVSASASFRYPPASSTSPLSGISKPLSQPPRSYSRRSAPESALRKKAIERARQQRRGTVPLTRSVSI